MTEAHVTPMNIQAVFVLILVTTIVMLLVAFPTSAVGRMLREALVESPARRLNRISPGKIAFYGALGLAGVVLFLLFETEGVRLFSLMAPDLIVWFTAFDVSLFLDVLIIAVTLSATVRLRAAITPVVRGVRQIWFAIILRASGHARANARTSPGKRSLDDPDPTIYAFALA